jgi:outer membrane protein OmpA-like peptidoglycan-associated protein
MDTKSSTGGRPRGYYCRNIVKSIDGRGVVKRLLALTIVAVTLVPTSLVAANALSNVSAGASSAKANATSTVCTYTTTAGKPTQYQYYPGSPGSTELILTSHPTVTSTNSYVYTYRLPNTYSTTYYGTDTYYGTPTTYGTYNFTEYAYGTDTYYDYYPGTVTDTSTSYGTDTYNSYYYGTDAAIPTTYGTYYGSPTVYTTTLGPVVTITTHHHVHNGTTVTNYTTTVGPSVYTTSTQAAVPTVMSYYTYNGTPTSTDTYDSQSFATDTYYSYYPVPVTDTSTSYGTDTYVSNYSVPATYYGTPTTYGTDTYNSTYSLYDTYGPSTYYTTSTYNGGPTTTSYAYIGGSPGGRALVGAGTPTTTQSHCTPVVTLTVPPTGSGTSGGTSTVNPTTNDPAGLSYSSQTPTVCTVDPTTGVVTFLTAGTCVIKVTVTATAGFTGTATATQTIKVGQGRLRVLGFCHFAINSYVLTPQCKATLASIAKAIQTKGLTSVTIQGYASISGNPSINNPLSENRALAVQSYLNSLLQGLGINNVSISAHGYGATGPKQTEAYIYY